MEALVGAIMGAFGLVIMGGLMLLMVSMINRNELVPHADFGIRTAATKSCPQAWDAGHHAAKPFIRWTGIVAFAAAILKLVVAILVRDSPNSSMWHAVMFSLAYGTVIAMVLIATRHANKAAREVANQLHPALG